MMTDDELEAAADALEAEEREQAQRRKDPVKERERAQLRADAVKRAPYRRRLPAGVDLDAPIDLCVAELGRIPRATLYRWEREVRSAQHALQDMVDAFDVWDDAPQHLRDDEELAATERHIIAQALRALEAVAGDVVSANQARQLAANAATAETAAEARARRAQEGLARQLAHNEAVAAAARAKRAGEREALRQQALDVARASLGATDPAERERLERSASVLWARYERAPQ